MAYRFLGAKFKSFLTQVAEGAVDVAVDFLRPVDVRRVRQALVADIGIVPVIRTGVDRRLARSQIRLEVVGQCRIDETRMESFAFAVTVDH